MIRGEGEAEDRKVIRAINVMSDPGVRSARAENTSCARYETETGEGVLGGSTRLSLTNALSVATEAMLTGPTEK